jgi:hypothetical protein
MTDMPHFAGIRSADNSEKSCDLTILLSVAIVIVGLLAAIFVSAGPVDTDANESTTTMAIPL